MLPYAEYWCDIGGTQQYRQANYDILSGLVKVNIVTAGPDGVYWGRSNDSRTPG